MQIKYFFYAALGLPLLLAGCGEAGPGPEIHDTKYRAVDAAGTVEDPSVAPGACVLDTFTGLTWEVRTADGGLRDAIESINARYRRAVRARGHFPNEAAALKCLYLVTRSLDPTGGGRARWVIRSKPALNAFAITFAGRFDRTTH